jgi:hypothetical protein
MATESIGPSASLYGAIDFIATGFLVLPGRARPAAIQLHAPRSWTEVGVPETLVMTALSPAARRFIGAHDGKHFDLRLGDVAVRARRYGQAFARYEYAFLEAADVFNALAIAMKRQATTRTKSLREMGVVIGG